MKHLLTYLGAHVVLIIFFTLIYWGVYDGKNFDTNGEKNNEKMSFYQFLFYSITTQSGVGMSYITPTSYLTRAFAALQQFLVLVVITGSFRTFSV
jgi:hypothetical protein